MAQLILIPNQGEGQSTIPLSDDLVAFYRFEETEDLSVAIDWKMNFNGKTRKERANGYIGKGLVCDKKENNFSVNMLLDEIPSSLKISVDFYIKFLEEIKRGEHATYTLFSKQWASGMKWYAFILTRLESIKLISTFCYLNSDVSNSSVQITGATFSSINANGVYYKISDIRYNHSVYPDWYIQFIGNQWQIIHKEKNVDVIHFYKEGNDVSGDYITTSAGSGKVKAIGVIERNENVEIDMTEADFSIDKWHRIVLILDLRTNYLSKLGIYFDDKYATKDTDFVVDIPVNSKISPQLIGGDISDVKFCENDNSIPLIVDGLPFPSSHRYGVSAIIDEVGIWKILRKPHYGSERPKLFVEVYGYGSVNINPQKEDYDFGEEVQLTANPDSGYYFSKWTGDVPEGHETDNPLTITMTKGDKYIYAYFTGKVATPQFNPDEGTYNEEKDIIITCATEGATIRYTTDGSEPNLNSPVYSEPVHISQNTILKAKGFKEGYDPSDTKTGNYILKVKTPIFNPPPGQYSEVDVEITCQTSEATIRYTTDGTDPNESSNVYTSPIHITDDTTLKAKAWKTNWQASDIQAGFYDIIHNQWIRKANAPITFSWYDTKTFIINGKAYILDTYYQSLWMYDPDLDSYTQKASPIGNPRHYAVSFSIGNYGFYGTGYMGGNPETFYKDFYKYDSINNNWSQIADLPGNGRYGAIVFSIGDYGFCGSGYQQSIKESKDFYKYDLSNNSWIQIADIPVKRMWGIGFSIGDKGYAGRGQYWQSSPPPGDWVILNDFYEYNPSLNQWLQKANYPGGAYGFETVFGFSDNNYGYSGFGKDAQGNSNWSIYKYVPLNNIWQYLTNFTDGVGLFAISGKIYAGKHSTNQLWVYYQ